MMKEEKICFELFRFGDEELQEAESSYKRTIQPPSLFYTHQDQSKIQIIVSPVTDVKTGDPVATIRLFPPPPNEDSRQKQTRKQKEQTDNLTSDTSEEPPGRCC